MPQIVTKLYFSKANGLNIPLAIENPNITGSTSSPNNSMYLDNLCIEIEKKLLLNALGLVLYNELQLALADIDNVIYARWKSLINGNEYDGKIWVGLKHDLNFIAQNIYETYVTRTNEHLTAVGNSKVNSENSTLVTPTYKIANAHQMFVKGYQGGFLQSPNIYRTNNHDIIDWFGDNEEIEVSFYQYLRDKQADFTELDLSKFKVYNVEEIKNSFGI